MDLTKITPISTEPFEFGPIQAKWLEALESGEYLQGTGTLKSQEPAHGTDKHTYCCLGVLCELNNVPWEVGKDSGQLNGFIFPNLGKHLNYPTGPFRDQCGLRTISGGLKTTVLLSDETGQVLLDNLAAMNDCGNPTFTFKDIAAYIRHDPHNVFERAA